MSENKLPPKWTNEIPDGMKDQYYSEAQTKRILKKALPVKIFLVAMCVFMVLTFLWAILTNFTALHHIAGYICVGISGGLFLFCLLCEIVSFVRFKKYVSGISADFDGICLLDEKDGVRKIELYNGRTTAVVCSLGARLISLKTPCPNGGVADVAAGFGNVKKYKTRAARYFGATVGRVAGRIAGARIRVNGEEFVLSANEGANHLHGGTEGFDQKIWTVEYVSNASVKFTYVSTDMEEGYPGNLTVGVTYSVKEDNSLRIEYEATCDRDTPLSLTNHTYFNVDGKFGDVSGETLFIAADKVTVVDEELIPTGEELDVEGTAFDFKKPRAISFDAAELAATDGYDINYVLAERDNEIEPCATLHSDVTGLTMSVYTDRPCMQVYTGNYLKGERGKGRTYKKHSAICFETQAYPGGVEILQAGRTFSSVTEYKFGSGEAE